MIGEFRISVVIPAYNRDVFLLKTLLSIFNQTKNADEIIVVDDGSTDHTNSVLATCGDRITVITIPNSGDLVARNTGVRAATGDLVAFCDSDDLWRPDFLADMVQFWTADQTPLCAHSDFHEIRDGVWSTESKFDQAPLGFWDDLRPVGGERFLFERPIIRDLLAFQPFFPSCLMVHKAQFLALGGWDEGVSRMVGCDFATTLRMAEHPPIGVLRRPLVGIRKHAGNISGDVQRMNLGDADVLTYVLATRPSLAGVASAIRRSIAARRLSALDTAFARGDFTIVTQIAAQLDPPSFASARWVKQAVAGLSVPLRQAVWRALTRAGTIRSAGQ